MKHHVYSCIAILLCITLLVGVGCKKKAPPVAPPEPEPEAAPAPPPAVAPAPSIELSASPSTIRRGEESTLRWNSSNAESVVIDAGIGNVGTSGSIRVSPLESTTYTATAAGGGRQARASARITVMEARPPEVAETDIQALRRAIAEGRVRPVFFDYDSAELTRESRTTLEENARWFRKYPGADLTIEGHCDERGTEEYNLALGDRRAQTASDYLVQLGIPSSRLETVSFGEERPFAPGHNEAAWSQNRRAHFVVR